MATRRVAATAAARVLPYDEDAYPEDVQYAQETAQKVERGERPMKALAYAMYEVRISKLDIDLRLQRCIDGSVPRPEHLKWFHEVLVDCQFIVQAAAEREAVERNAGRQPTSLHIKAETRRARDAERARQADDFQAALDVAPAE